MNARYMTQAQETSLRNLCARYSNSALQSDNHVQDFNDRGQPFDLPSGYVTGWIWNGYTGRRAICVGISPEGAISS